jgi:hypothetical protein
MSSRSARRHAAVGRVAGEAESDRVPGEVCRQMPVENGRKALPISVRHEQLQPQTPIVVSRHGVVESQDLRPGPQARRRIPNVRSVLLQQRADEVLEVRARKRDALARSGHATMLACTGCNILNSSLTVRSAHPGIAAVRRGLRHCPAGPAWVRPVGAPWRAGGAGRRCPHDRWGRVGGALDRASSATSPRHRGSGTRRR